MSPAAFTPTPDAFFAHVHPDDRDRLLAHAETAPRGEQPHDVEFRIVRPDGELRHVHERAEVELDDAGQVAAVTGTIQDITERRHLDERLHQYRQLVESSHEPLAVIRPDYRYVLANGAYAERYGFAGRNLEGAHVSEIIGQHYFENDARAWIDRAFAGELQIYEAERTYPWVGTRRL